MVENFNWEFWSDPSADRWNITCPEPEVGQIHRGKIFVRSKDANGAYFEEWKWLSEIMPPPDVDRIEATRDVKHCVGCTARWEMYAEASEKANFLESRNDELESKNDSLSRENVELKKEVERLKTKKTRYKRKYLELREEHGSMILSKLP